MINKSRISHGLVPDDPSSSSDGVAQVFVAAALQPCMRSPLVVDQGFICEPGCTTLIELQMFKVLDLSF